MQSTLDKHRAVIPALAIGISESSPLHLRPATLDAFMTRMLRSRISRRVVTSQHIALTTQFRARQGKGKLAVRSEGMDNMVGVVETKLTADKVVRRCVEMLRRRGAVDVPVVMEGAKDVEFACKCLMKGSPKSFTVSWLTRIDLQTSGNTLSLWFYNCSRTPPKPLSTPTDQQRPLAVR